jgi:PKD repeat protein
MKQKHLLNFTIIVAAAITFMGCQKLLTPVTNPKGGPQAGFTTDSYSPFVSGSTLSMGLVDSNFYFTNTSDEGTGITYKWDFDDGTTSTVKSPKHIYTTSGQFTVALTVTKDKKSTTLNQVLTVIDGQHDIPFSYEADGKNIIENADGSFIILAIKEFNAPFLIKLDKELRQKSVLQFSSANIINTIQATNDGNYILTGNVSGGTANTDLIKMNTNGTFLWRKPFTDILKNVVPAADGGYIVIATRTGTNGTQQPVIIKTDASGNEQWENFFGKTNSISFTSSTVVENDGYVVANAKGTDSVILTKVNLQGNLLWQKSTPTGLTSPFFFFAGIDLAKNLNGNYAVSPTNSNGFFVFSPTGALVSKKVVAGLTTVRLTTSTLGDILLFGNDDHVKSFSAAGVAKWEFANLYWGVKDPATGSIIAGSAAPNAVTLTPLRNGGSILLTGKGVPLPNGTIYHAITVLKVDKSGDPL